MAGDFGAPYREPCGGWPENPRRWLPNHAKENLRVPAYENVTQMRDFDALGSFIDPYPLGLPGAGVCPDTTCTTGRTEGTQPCYPIHLAPAERAYWLSECSAGIGQSAMPGADFNCYRATGELSPVHPCRKIGFKNVQCRYNWYGLLAFTDQCHCDPYSPTQVRYTRLHVEYHHVQDTLDGFSGDYSILNARFTGTVQVNPYTGEVTKPGCYEHATVDSNITGHTEYDNAFWIIDPRDEGGTVTLKGAFWDADCGGESTFIGLLPTYWPDAVINYEYHTGTDGSYKVTLTDTTDGGGGHSREYVEVYYRLDGVSEFDVILHRAYGVLNLFRLDDDTQYPWRTDDYGSVAPLCQIDQAPLVDFRTYITETCFVDDYRMPTSDGAGNAPFSVGWNPTYGKMPWFDPNFYRFVYPPGESSSTAAAIDFVANYSGQGCLPNPPGFEGHWDFQHPTYSGVEDGLDCEICEVSRGARSGANDAGDATDAVVPACATRWTDTEEAVARRRGAWIDVTGDSAGGTIVVQKWAEILLPWGSINFARPCGEDRGVLEGAGGMDWIVVASSTFPNIVTEGDPSIITNDYCAVNWSTYDGIYQVTKTGTGQYNIGSKLWEIPSWVSAPTSGLRQWHDNTICRMRWIAQRGICSTVNVLNAEQTDTGEVTIRVDADVFLLGRPIGSGSGGESLVFTDVAGLGTVEVIEVDATEPLRVFVVAGTLGAWTSGGTVISAGYDASNDKWNDDNPKRDFITRIWVENPYDEEDGRTWEVTETQRCLFPVPCDPSVVCYTNTASQTSPESFPNGTVIEMPSSLTVDPCHGTLWFADVVQAEGDPFWNVPPGPQAEDAWEEDTGACLADVGGGSSIQYYPHRPMVEPRLTLPTGAPSLASGVTLHTETEAPPSEVGRPVACTSLPATTGLIHALWLALRTSAAEPCNGYDTWFRGC